MKRLEPPVSIALAGLGDVSLQHKRAIDMCGQAHLTGVWTRNPEKRRRLAGEWNVVNYPDYDALLDDDTVQVVDIAAADEVHYDLTLRALDAGKHVIIEKPPAETQVRILEMKAAADKRGLFCIPMHNYVYRKSGSGSPNGRRR